MGCFLLFFLMKKFLFVNSKWKYQTAYGNKEKWILNYGLNFAFVKLLFKKRDHIIFGFKS